MFISHHERRIEVSRRGAKGWSCDFAGPDDSTLIHGQEIGVAAIYG